MRLQTVAALPVLLAAVFAASLNAQTAAGKPKPAAQKAATQAHTSPVGYSYELPTDWEVVDLGSSVAAVQQQAGQAASTDEEKKGIACVQMSLTARHGVPPSMVNVMALPFDCFGSVLAESDLPGFAAGAMESLKAYFDISEPTYGSYPLGTHSMWITRASGVMKAQPDLQYTVETVCSVLKKGAVCWMTMARDAAALAVFERGKVALDGEAPSALVPSDAFAHKPSSAQR